MPADPTTRITLANRLRALSETIPAEVTDRFLERHPDWITRYGDRARQFGIEDARYHLVFLATAV